MTSPELLRRGADGTATTFEPELELDVVVPPARWRSGPFGHPVAIALVCYALLGLVANYPNWPGDPSHLATCACGGNQDPAQTVWFLAWTPYALLHGHNPFLSSWVNYPLGVNLAQNTSMPLLGLITAPLTLGVSPVASENLLRWMAFPLSAFSLFLVARQVVRWSPAAFIAGLLYGFSPYMIGQASVHLNLSFVPLPPLILYACYELVVVQGGRARRWGVMLGVLAVAQFYISAEILATTALTAVVATVLLACGAPRQLRAHLLHALRGFAVAASITAVCIAYPVWLMIAGPGHYVGPSQGASQFYNTDVFSTIVPTFSELVAPHRLAAVSSSLLGSRGNIDENGSYLGIPFLGLIGALARRSAHRRWFGFLVLVAVATYVVSLGPSVTFEGRTIALPFALPFAAIRHLPLLGDVLPARLSLYVMLFLALAVALGLDGLRAHFADARQAWGLGRSGRVRRSRAPVVEAALVLVLALVAFVALLPRWPYRSVALDRPPGVGSEVLAAIPPGTAVLTYPYSTPFTDDAMLWQALSGMRFREFGSYMLRPGVVQRATAWPSDLRPLVVQAMLSTPLSPIALGGIPYFAPTTRTLVATRVLLGIARHPGSSVAGASVVGVIENVNPATGAFYVATPHLGLTGVTVTGATRLVNAVGAPGAPTSPQRAVRVAVYGRSVTGTITAEHIRDLRTFLRAQRVGAVLVATGRLDARNVATWLRAAIGEPSRVYPDAELWLGIPERLARLALETHKARSRV